jgi:hypothetical protein
MASFVTLDAAMYSASTVDSMTVGCFFEAYDMEPPATSKM